jgi:hypothetical protein
MEEKAKNPNPTHQRGGGGVTVSLLASWYDAERVCVKNEELPTPAKNIKIYGLRILCEISTKSYDMFVDPVGFFT